MSNGRYLNAILVSAAGVSICVVALTWVHEIRTRSGLDGLLSERRSLVAAINEQKAASRKNDADENAVNVAIGDFDLSSLPKKVRKTIERLEDPRFSRLTTRQLDSDYAALFRKLKLPEGKLSILKGLLADRLNVEREALQLSIAEDLALDELPNEGDILAAGTAEIDATIAQDFGAETSSAIETYQASLSARKFMIQPFADHLRFGPDSLTDSQLDALSTAASGVPFGANTIIARPPGPPIPTALDDAVVGILSETQQAAYQEYKTVWEANRQKSILDLAFYLQKQAARANSVTQ